MNEIISKRKSIRKYNPAKLDESILQKVRGQIEKLKPLYPDIKYSIEIVDKTKGIFGIAAPHYLVFFSEEKEGHLENIGFLGQQMDLFLSSEGLGACWLGMAKPEKKDGALPHKISMAFGEPAEPLYRDPSEFKRKALSEMSEGDDPRLEAARLAPSGMNAQNWYFIAADGKIHSYCKKPTLLSGLLAGALVYIDFGIALCHIAEESETFSFVKEEGVPERKNLIYMGTVIS